MGSFLKKRNHIAHNKLIDQSAYKIIQKSIENVENVINSAEQAFNSNVLSDEEKEKVRNLEAIFDFEASLADREIMEAETGVTINTKDAIEDILDENTMGFISDLMDSIYFRNDLNISF